MKKRFLILLPAFFMTAIMYGQTMYDALRFSENYYEGSARTMAMGNAFTALGGDPGAVTINPAGSAVAKYSQITITPGISISSNTASGTILSGDSSPYSFENRIKNSNTRFGIPNFALTLNFDTHRTSGIKNYNVGFVLNTTNRFQDALMASGTNYYTSYAGALAAGSSGYEVSALENADNYYNGYAWSSILGIHSGLMNTFGTNTSEYVGVTEKVYDNGDGNSSIELAGPLNQRFRRRIGGAKYDYVFNFGFNISDVVYLGANLGITSLNYRLSERFVESAIDPNDFEITYNNTDGSQSTTYFSSLQHDYAYTASGVGVYGKFGILVTPGGGFRLGAAIQTPTSTSITERWQESASSSYSDSNFDMSAETPEGEYTYTLISPLRFNVGLAYALGSVAVLSADYEMCNYSSMKFVETDDPFGSGVFDPQNEDIKEYMGASHMLRVGLEVKPFSSLALRAGYNLTTSPEKYLDENDILKKSGANVHKLACGIGYISKGSFYADAACGYTIYNKEYVYPYNDYVDFPSPEIMNKKGLWQVMLTLGFRF